jgi:hypothetical protein
MRPTAPIGGTMSATTARPAAISSAPPVVRSASLTGMSAPSRIRIGHSMT